MINLLWVALGGFFGAIARVEISKLLNKHQHRTKLPLGTFLVNTVGSFLLGLVVAQQLSTTLNLLLAVGFLGSFTTFSTFKVESVYLHNKSNPKYLYMYLSLTYLVGISFAAIGFWVSSLL